MILKVNSYGGEGPFADFRGEGTVFFYIKKGPVIHMQSELSSRKIVAEFSDTIIKAERLLFCG